MDFIRDKEDIPQELAAYLKTEVYLASHQYKGEREREYERNMLNDGWGLLTPDKLKQAYKEGNKLEISTSCQGAIITSKIEGVFKPFVNENGTCYLMKPRASRKGYLLQNLDKVFYKALA